MRNIRFLTPVLVVLALLAGSAQAVTWTWTAASPTDANDWNDPDNWDTGVGDANIPGFGDYAGDDILVPLDNAILDLGATNPNIGSFTTKHRDTDDVTVRGTGTLTATSIFNSDRCSNLNFHPNLVVSGRIWNNSKGDIDNFYGTVVADSLDLGASAPLFHQAVTITNVADGLEAFYRSISTGGNNNWKFDDVLNASKVRIWSDTVGYTSTIAAQDANTLSGVTGAVTVDSGGILNLVAAQNTFPVGGVYINAGGRLDGNAVGATWGDGNDIRVAEDAILNTTAGLPTASDLGLVSGTTDALAWKPVIADGTYEYGDEGDSIWKGMAVGGFTSTVINKTLVSPVGAGDVEVRWLGKSYNKVVIKMDVISMDETGVANFDVFGTFSSTQANGGFNRLNSDANAATTFNINSNFADTATAATLTGNFVVKDDQTFNFTGGGKATIDPTEMHGQLTFSDRMMLLVTDEQFNSIGTSPNAKLTFNAGTALSFSSDDVLALEEMNSSQIVMHPDALLCLETGGNNNPLVFSPQFDITDANNPNLVAIMKTHNVLVKAGNNNYADMQGQGIQLGDGKWLIEYGDTHKGLRMRADANSPNAMIHSAGPGTTMGIAAVSNNHADYLYVMIPIDANGATVNLNSPDDFTVAVGGNNARYTGPADNHLELMSPILKAAEVVVLGKGVQISDDIVDSGMPLGALLPIRVASTGNLDFQHVADSDGYVVSNLAKTQITIDQGGRVFVDGDMSVNSMVLNSTYSDGNSGLHISSLVNDDPNIAPVRRTLAVSGRLSGDGDWGGDGTLIIAGTVAPGNGAGTLTGSNLNLANGATYEWQLAADGDGAVAGDDYDTIVLSSDLVFEGAWDIDLDFGEFIMKGEDEFILFSTTGGDFFGLYLGTVTVWDGETKLAGATVEVGMDSMTIVLSGISSGLDGDTNDDGVVNAADYMALKRHMGTPNSATLADGDFDGSGTVDFADLQLLIGNFDQTSGGAGTIPEPATLCLLAFGAMAVIRRRRRS